MHGGVHGGVVDSALDLKDGGSRSGRGLRVVFLRQETKLHIVSLHSGV